MRRTSPYICALLSLFVLSSAISFAYARKQSKHSAAKPPAYTAYLMAYFGPEQKLYYAISRDARHWMALNGGKPVFDPGPGIALRDPFLNRVGDTFHLVHTKGWDHPEIFHWESTDLLHWEGGVLPVVPASAKRAWAPEFYYSPQEQLFYVFWASEYNGHNAIYYVKSRDWLDITPDASQVYYDLGIDDIDFTVTEYKGTYYAFHKPGTVDDMLGNQLLISRSLDPTIERFGQKSPSKEVLPAPTKPIEGPEIIKLIGENRWYIYGDPFHAPMEAWETRDFKTFTKIEVLVPPASKHCSMIPITEAELTRLQVAYPAV